MQPGGVLFQSSNSLNLRLKSFILQFSLRLLNHKILKDSCDAATAWRSASPEEINSFFLHQECFWITCVRGKIFKAQVSPNNEAVQISKCERLQILFCFCASTVLLKSKLRLQYTPAASDKATIDSAFEFKQRCIFLIIFF